MERRILHVDFNGFYASVECLLDPALRSHPVAVAGDPERRHGIILAKNELAKAYKVKTGEAIWQAKEKCPDLVVVKPHFEEYVKFSRLGRELYGEYSDRVEAFGLDENWIDLTGRAYSWEETYALAQEIRQRVKDELGITVSVGAADNKIFAKLGSDLKKPDAVTLITPASVERLVWTLPVGELLYVGPATQSKLLRCGIATIGDLARANVEFLRAKLGKGGVTLHVFANGQDVSEVAQSDWRADIKSVGNGVTAPRDLVDNEDVKLTLMMLCESVATRLREHGFRARTLQLGVRDTGLYSFVRQRKLEKPSCLAGELLPAAMGLFCRCYPWQTPVRSLTVSASELIPDNAPQQLSLFGEETERIRFEKAERTVDEIRSRFGYASVLRGRMLSDRRIGLMNPREEHTIHPVGYRVGEQR